jgi:alpha-L-rhamnosidase
MAGEFACSNELLNQLQSNIVWGQRGNYFEVPTDCPQRDERLGWTGDAQVFVRTATFNMNVAPFFEKWMADMRDAQQPNGEFPHYAPRLDEKRSSAAWADAGVICPWVIYERYGNLQILADNFDAMRRWVDFQETSSKNLIRPNTGYGDWLAIDAPKPGAAPTPKPLIGTAYFAHTANLVAKAAAALGRKTEAEHYAQLAGRIKAAFNREFVNADGRLIKETQTGYLLALGFDLLPESKREVAVAALIEDIKSRDWHLSTGFVGTGLLMPVLSKVGRNDVAYRILLQETYPGWLYSIRQGATTMWERWNSYTHTDGFGPVGMNSFNHYAYGAVGEWLYAVIAGIDAGAPGFKKILIQPQPGGGLTWAKGRLDSPYGVIATEWKLDGDNFTLAATIPANTTATVLLPNGERHEVGAGQHNFTVKQR